MNPAYISVTYGAGGTEANNTAIIAEKVKLLGVEPLAHLTCVNNDKVSVEKELDEFKSKGIENILALRGDIVPGVEPKKDFYMQVICVVILRQEVTLNLPVLVILKYIWKQRIWLKILRT